MITWSQKDSLSSEHVRKKPEESERVTIKISRGRSFQDNERSSNSLRQSNSVRLRNVRMPVLLKWNYSERNDQNMRP